MAADDRQKRMDELLDKASIREVVETYCRGIDRVHPDLAAYLDEEGREDLARLEAALDVKVIVQGVDKQPHREEYDIKLR